MTPALEALTQKKGHHPETWVKFVLLLELLVKVSQLTAGTFLGSEER